MSESDVMVVRMFVKLECYIRMMGDISVLN